MKYLNEKTEAALKRHSPHMINVVVPDNSQHIATLRRNKKKVVAEMKSMLDLIDKEKRDFTTQETIVYDVFVDGIDNIDEKISLNEAAEKHFSSLKNQEKSAHPGGEIIFAKGRNTALPDHSLQGLSIGSMMKTMAIGAKTDLEFKAMQEGVDSAGGFTVPTELMRDFIDLLRSKSVTQSAGAQTVLLQTEKTSIARLASDPAASWRSELGAVSESDPTFENVSFTARSLAVLVKVSRELLEDSLNVETALMNALAQSMALEIDRVSLFGSGVAPEPLGIINTVGVLSVDMGTNGATLTDYADFISALQKLAEANAGNPTASIMAPRTKFTYAGLTDSTGQPLMAPKVVNDVQQMDTTSVAIDDTHGTAVDASKIVMGDFTQLLLGLRSGLRIEILREKYADTMEVAFLAHLRMDVAVAHPESFCQIEGIIP